MALRADQLRQEANRQNDNAMEATLQIDAGDVLPDAVIQSLKQQARCPSKYSFRNAVALAHTLLNPVLALSAAARGTFKVQQ